MPFSIKKNSVIIISLIVHANILCITLIYKIITGIFFQIINRIKWVL